MSEASFDLISDLHADFWLDHKCSKQLSVDRFVDELLPDNPSDVLVIAGDLGHHNTESELLLKSFRRYYRNVLYVVGNHDYYLVNSKERWKNNYRSRNRIINLKETTASLEGVTFLDGTTITIDGTTYGGCGMWHDMSYGVSLGFSQSELYYLWGRSMNDSSLIIPTFTENRLRTLFESELAKLEHIFDQCQVIVTHVGPDVSNVINKYKNDPVTTFFYFDGSTLLERANGKTWCFSHTHTHYDYIHDKCCRLVNNALGYPDEHTKSKIRTIYR
ncbi:hypothetical protein FHR92_003766 [Fontibacillus solani]|uniref:Calcineurin-like phosphoesterase domain-containing protein n=1 Tax=Fontibacillus solani TaxID=1572857 RepID=A0A7W3SW41_9BACL|nr:metallophosphoesterase [Fontibacillus solani]MBA9087282.1 hypothetical protein [Fontibacillus solani]